jgi:hypothetical protein
MVVAQIRSRTLVSVVTILVITTVIAAPVLGSPSSHTVDQSAQASPLATETLLQSTAQTQFEPNDDFANATQIDPGTYDNLAITQGDIDIYAVDVESATALSASIEFVHSEGDLELYLINPAQDAVLQSSTSETDDENITHVATESGTYYLAVVGYQGATASYNLTVATIGDGPSPVPPAGGPEAEPNDDFENATQIQPGSYSDRNITENDIDVYGVNLTSGEAISASIQFAHAEGDLELYLINPAQDAVLQSSTSETDDENITHIATESGTYYLAVVGHQGATASYNLTVSTTGDSTSPTPPSGETEPNNDFATATQVDPGTYTDLEITENDSLDFYAVELERTDALSASIQFAHADGDLDLFLVGPDQSTVLQSSTSGTDDENITHLATETGTYYLIVVGYQGATAPYNLTIERATGSDEGPKIPGSGDTVPDVNSDFEPNDDFENASTLGPGTYTGFEITENDTDIYGVELTSGEGISASIQFAQADGDLDLFLVNPAQSEIIQSSTSESDNENLTHIATESGTYYLAVVGYQGATAPYNLTIHRSGNIRPPDPDADRLGWENGYWANETIGIDQSDGLSEDERAALLARSMARVEEIRRLEFQRNVSFSIISREEFGQLRNQTDTSPIQRLQFSSYYNSVYEATFIVDEKTDAYDEVVGDTGLIVGGFYIPGTDQFTLITEDADRPTVDEGILIHELVHALQDQYSFVSQPATTADESSAQLGLSEGEANYIEALYERRCQIDWECVPEPQTDSSGGGDLNLGLTLIGFQPYSDGPGFVAQLFDQGGWAAVTQAYDDPPVSTEHIIHPERYPDDQPTALKFTPRPTGDWRLFGTERIGEAWLFSMFWYQAREFGSPVLNTSTISEPDGGEFDTLNYTSTPSEGWGNDQLYMFTNGTQRGYVWNTVWDTETDAEQFESAYHTLLRGQGAQQVAADRWVIPEAEPYADAFAVSRSGATVTIVNGPTEADLPAIAPTVVTEANQTEE